MYISKVVLSWEPVLVGGFGAECDDWDLPYNYLQHAEEVLCAAPDKPNHLIDVISNLKRAVDHRIKHISTTHRIKKTLSYVRQNNMWSTLEGIGLVKPLMLGNLLDIRNAIEHQFSTPPSTVRCTELSEFVWYFLKSTDQIAKRTSDGFALEEGYNCPFDCPYSFHYEGLPENNWKPTITTCLHKELISAEPKTDYFEVLQKTVQSGYEYKAMLAARMSETGPTKTAKDVIACYSDEDVVLTGRLNDIDVQMWFERLYFKTIII